MVKMFSTYCQVNLLLSLVLYQTSEFRLWWLQSYELELALSLKNEPLERRYFSVSFPFWHCRSLAPAATTSAVIRLCSRLNRSPLLAQAVFECSDARDRREFPIEGERLLTQRDDRSAERYCSNQLSFRSDWLNIFECLGRV